jgi:hypothetical protein
VGIARTVEGEREGGEEVRAVEEGADREKERGGREGRAYRFECATIYALLDRLPAIQFYLLDSLCFFPLWLLWIVRCA